MTTSAQRAATGPAGPVGLRKLLVAQAMSQLGFQVMSLAMPIVAVLSLNASPFQVSAVTAAQTAAFLLIGLPVGALVDRMRRRRVMIAADFGRAVLLATVPLAWWLGVLSVGLLCVIAFCTGMLTVFFDVADMSYLPDLVGRDHLLEANSKLIRVDSLATVVGPGLGGGLVQLFTAPMALVATVCAFLTSGLFVARIRHAEPVPQRRRGSRLHHEIVEGIRQITTDRLIRPIALCTTTLLLFWGMAYAMLPVLLARELAVPVGKIGLLLTVGSVGGLLATIVVSKVIKAIGESRAIRLSMAVTTPFTLLNALVYDDWRLWLVSVSGFALAAGFVVYNVAQVSFRQRRVPGHLLGRVNATIRFFAWGAWPIGNLCGGLLAELVGVRYAILIGTAGASLAFLWLQLSPMRGMRHLPVGRADGPADG